MEDKFTLKAPRRVGEEEFLKSTPKKLFKLAEIHQSINNPNSQEESKPKEQEVYIDQLF